MRKPKRGLRLPAPRTWFLALVFAVAAFAVLHGPDIPSGGSVRSTPAFWPHSSTAYAAAADYFLKVDGIPGDVTVDGYRGQIMLDSWQFGDARGVLTNLGSREVSAPVCSDFLFTKVLDKSSPGLFQQSLSGEAIPRVVLSGVRTATPTQVLFLRVSFTGALASSYSLSSGGSIPTESISFNYLTLTVEYRKQNPDGTFVNSCSSSKNVIASGLMRPFTTPTKLASKLTRKRCEPACINTCKADMSPVCLAACSN